MRGEIRATCIFAAIYALIHHRIPHQAVETGPWGMKNYGIAYLTTYDPSAFTVLTANIFFN